MQQNKNKLRIFSIMVLAMFVLGLILLVSNTISKDASINESSADVVNVQCGNIDTNQNGILDLVDYNEIRLMVGKNCIDIPAQTYCGPKDTNRDSKIDIKDMATFGSRYNKPNCGL